MPIWLTLARIECQRVLRQTWLWHHRLAYGFAVASLFAYALYSEPLPIRRMAEVARQFFDWWSVFHMFSCYLWVAVLARGAFAGDAERASLDSVKSTTADGYDFVRARCLARLWAFFILICPAFPVIALGFSMNSISVVELVVLAIWTVVTASYVCAITIAFSVSRKSPGAALGGTMLCLAGMSMVPGLSPWHQLFWIDADAGLFANYLVLSVTSWIPLLIAWQALRRAGEVVETPYDLVGLKVSSDENHRAAGALEAASAVGKFFAWVVVFVAAVPSLGGYGFLLFYCFLDGTVMQMLFLLIPATAVFLAFLFLRILASPQFDRRRSLLVELFATPLPAARAVWKQLWTCNLPLRVAFVALVAASLFGVAAAGLPGAVLIAILWLHLVATTWAAAAIRLSNDSAVAAVVVGVLYVLGIWVLPFLAPFHTPTPLQFAEYAGWTALATFVVGWFWRPAVGWLLVRLQAPPDSLAIFSPAMLLAFRYDYLIGAAPETLWTAMRPAAAHLFAAALECVVVYAWLAVQVDQLVGRPGFVERVFAPWLRSRKSRFGFPFPLR